VGSNPTAPANYDVKVVLKQQLHETGMKMAKSSIVEFVQDVRDETNKITWPTRRELGISTVMVMIMVVAASLFFLGVDAILNWGVEKVLFGF
jgi:preprotein translocase subunit SecE